MRAGSGATIPITAALLVAALVGGAPADGAQDATGDEDERHQRGGVVYHASCAACHGTSGTGGAGTGVAAGPAIDDVPVAAVDLVLRTGKMPIARPELGVLEDQLDDADREAVVAFMQDRFDLPGSLPRPGVGDASRGLDPFVRHCAACHGAAGAGGVAGGGTFVPDIAGRDPVTIVEALRVGPFEMPAFNEALIDDRTAADIAAYLDEANGAPATFLGLRELDPVGIAGASTVLVVAAAGLLRVLGRRRPRREEP